MVSLKFAEKLNLKYLALTNPRCIPVKRLTGTYLEVFGKLFSFITGRYGDFSNQNTLYHPRWKYCKFISNSVGETQVVSDKRLILYRSNNSLCYIFSIIHTNPCETPEEHLTASHNTLWTIWIPPSVKCW